MKRRSLTLIGLLGGAGGAINAWWCYAKFPVSAANDTTFAWHIVLTGAGHGALLAVFGVGMATWCWSRRLPMRLAGLVATGWVAGWLSFIPLDLYIKLEPHTPVGSQTLDAYDVLGVLTWPFQSGGHGQTFWQPYAWFGLVAVVYYFLLNLCRGLSVKSLIVQMGFASVAGCLGSLWWWTEFTPWYFSVLHGTIWGSLVGYGVWKSQQQLQHS